MRCLVLGRCVRGEPSWRKLWTAVASAFGYNKKLVEKGVGIADHAIGTAVRSTVEMRALAAGRPYPVTSVQGWYVSGDGSAFASVGELLQPHGP